MIQRLATCHAKIRETFKKEWVVEHIVRSRIQPQEMTPEKAETILAALEACVALTEDRDQDRFMQMKFVFGQGCLRVMETLGIYPEDHRIVTAACTLIAHVTRANQDAQKMLGPPCIELIAETLKIHGENEHVLRAGYAAIEALCEQCEPNTRKLKALKGVQRLFTGMAVNS